MHTVCQKLKINIYLLTGESVWRLTKSVTMKKMGQKIKPISPSEIWIEKKRKLQNLGFKQTRCFILCGFSLLKEQVKTWQV